MDSTVKNLKMIIVLLCLGIGALLFTHLRISNIMQEELAALEEGSHRLSKLIETETKKRAGLELEVKKLRERKEMLQREVESKREEIEGLRGRLEDSQ